MGCWQKQHDFKPSANIPISTTLRPSSHDTSRSNIVLADPFSPSEHCWLTTWNFSAHDFPWFSSPPFMNSYFYLSVWLCVADAIFVYKHLRDTFPRADLANSRTRELGHVTLTWVACENIRFSSLFAAGDVSREGTSATQRQKFHTDDANQCLHNESGSHGVPNINLSNFACLLVDFGEVLCSSANELQQNSNASSREDYIPEILTVLLEILRVYTWPLWPFVFCLSFVNNS